jgi:hypothetical protein
VGFERGRTIWYVLVFPKQERQPVLGIRSNKHFTFLFSFFTFVPQQPSIDFFVQELTTLEIETTFLLRQSRRSPLKKKQTQLQKENYLFLNLRGAPK